MIEETFRIITETIRGKKFRSFLTILGILIGTFLIVLLFSLSQGLKDAVTEQFSILGPDVITVEPGAGSFGSPAAFFGVAVNLKDDDLEVIEKTSGVKEVGGFNFRVVEVSHRGKKRFLQLNGLIEDAQVSLDLIPLQKGRHVEKSKDIIVGASFLDKDDSPFGKVFKIGDSLEIEGTKFKIVGFMKKFGSPDDISVTITYDSFSNLFDVDTYQTFFAKVSSGRDVDKVAESVADNLRDSRNVDVGEEDFTIATSKDILETFLNVLGIVQLAVVGFGVISIFVGFVGILNTMFTNILERTREIGVMKAIGARNSQILVLFLAESAFYGLLGGVGGVVFGLAAAKITELIISSVFGSVLVQAHISFALIFYSLLFSLVTGALAGIVPAYNASRANPVDSLRYE